jgi:hypothetical protein
MKKIKTITIVIVIFFSIKEVNVYGQMAADLPKRPFRQVTFETFFTPAPLDQIPDPLTGEPKTFWENTINGSVYVNLSKHFLFGFSYSHLWTRYSQKTLDKFFIAGIKGRYSYSLLNNVNLYADVGYNVGNYCSCLNYPINLDEFPFKRENMTYLSLGGGANIQLYKSLWFKVGAMGFLWLNKTDDIYFSGSNLPTIGLQLNLK